MTREDSQVVDILLRDVRLIEESVKLVPACDAVALFGIPVCPISLLIPRITSQLESSSSLHPFRFPFTDSLLFDLSLFCPLTLIPPPELPNSRTPVSNDSSRGKQQPEKLRLGRC